MNPASATPAATAQPPGKPNNPDGNPSGNLYADPAFLDVIAAVYHPGERCRAQAHMVGGHVFRLLTIDGQGAVPTQRFVDLHEPVAALPDARVPRLARLNMVGLGLTELDTFRQQPGWEAQMGAPTVQWADFPTWEDYLALLRSRRVLAEDQRRSRRLHGLFSALTFTADDLADDVLRTCIAWKSARDLKLGRADLFADPLHRRFFEALRERGLLHASTLRGNGTLLAIWLGAVHQGRWSGWIFCFNPDPDLARHSPGRQLLHAMLEHSHRAGHREFDFSIGLEPYKLHFATHVRAAVQLGTPPLAERASTTVRQWLAGSPWAYGQARALQRWWLARCAR